jgi:hypothetical protein
MNTAAWFAMTLGALIPTFLISRLYLWIMKSWDGGTRRLLVVHGGALLTGTLIGGMGFADGGAFAPLKALLSYALPQGLWFWFDYARLQRKR